jgi:hypothetical protein
MGWFVNGGTFEMWRLGGGAEAFQFGCFLLVGWSFSEAVRVRWIRLTRR